MVTLSAPFNFTIAPTIEPCTVTGVVAVTVTEDQVMLSSTAAPVSVVLAESTTLIGPDPLLPATLIAAKADCNVAYEPLPALAPDTVT